MARLSQSEALALAREHLAAGRVAEAELVSRSVVTASPESAEAHRLLGVAAYLRGDLAGAEALLRRTVELDCHSALAYDNLSLVLAAGGRPAEAEAASRHAVALAPDDANCWCNLAVACERLQRGGETLAAFHRAVELNPNMVSALRGYAQALHSAGEPAEAVRLCRRALQIQPNDPDTLAVLGAALSRQGLPDEAEASCRAALRIAPLHHAASVSLGRILSDQERWDEAEAILQEALTVLGDSPELLYNLGTVLQSQWRHEEAEAAYRRAIALQGGHAAAYNNLGMAVQSQGRLDEAEELYRTAARLEPENPHYQSNLLYCLSYRPGVGLADLASAHAAWNARFAAPLQAAWKPWPNDPTAERPLRVGFVSGDFGDHPVGRLFAPVLEQLDRTRFSAVCYSNRAKIGSVADRLRASAALWRDVADLSDDALAEHIRADRIDILFDLAGHTAHHRLLVFARKPAPIQITWLGYPCTTGVGAIDYLLADRNVAPPEAEEHYRERVLRMPDVYIPLPPPVLPLAEESPGAAENAGVVFASLNNPSKVSLPAIRAWGQILRLAPSSRLLLAYRSLSHPACRRYLSDRLHEQGVDPARIEFVGDVRAEERFGLFRRVDMALDSFPYSGTMTTCECLERGVPLITLAGETFAQRQSLTLLRAAGFEELVASTVDEYVRLALKLAEDPAGLAGLRASMRRRVAASSLCDVPTWVRHFERLMRQVWQAWRRDENPKSTTTVEGGRPW